MNSITFLTLTTSIPLIPYDLFHVEDESKIKEIIHHSNLTNTRVHVLPACCLTMAVL